jgi:hypothetical protein
MKRNEWSKRINEMQRVQMKIEKRSKEIKKFENIQKHLATFGKGLEEV